MLIIVQTLSSRSVIMLQLCCCSQEDGVNSPNPTGTVGRGGLLLVVGEPLGYQDLVLVDPMIQSTYMLVPGTSRLMYLVLYIL